MKVNSQLLVRIDKGLDYVPIASTMSNLVDLFIKYVILPKLSEEKINNNHYFTHIKEKSLDRCLLMFIPIIGNIVFGIIDFAYKKPNPNHNLEIQDLNLAEPNLNDKEFFLAYIRRDHRWGQHHTVAYLAETDQNHPLRDDREVALELIRATQANRPVLPHLSQRLRNDEDLVIERIRKDPQEIRNAGDIPKNSERVALETLNQRKDMFREFGYDIRNNEDILMMAMDDSGRAFQFASDRLKNKDDTVRYVTNIAPSAIKYASPRIRDLPEFAELVRAQNIIEHDGLPVGF